MTENNKGMQPASSEDELILVLDGIYSEIAKDIDSAKSSIVSEVKYSSVQSQSVDLVLYFGCGFPHFLVCVQNLPK